jgi:hypothetical protein
MRGFLRSAIVALGGVLLLGGQAWATPVCTDGYMGGAPRAACGGRVFPEAQNTLDYVQYMPDPTGFKEYQHGVEYLAQLYPRWVSVFTLRQRYNDADAVSVGPDGNRSYESDDTNDGHDILVVKLTDHQVPDAGKQTLLFSLSVHGDEKGGIEGGLRAAEDLAVAATNGGYISDGVPGYESTTGETPTFRQHAVSQILKKEAVYFIDFNIDGWRRGDHFAPSPGLYTRGNQLNTDLNRQMPTVGYINPGRNPLQESEMNFGHRLMHEVAAAGVNGQMAYGADIHGEGQSRAWVDIMYPAGQFNSVKHRRLMAIAERTKSVIDDTLYLGLANEIEEQTGGDAGEGIEDMGAPSNSIPTKPARWGTVWDTLGYTDTGFIGDYLATELGVTGMDYEIAFNHADTGRPYGRPWAYLFQENYINASRAIIKTAMAYAMTQDQDFADFQIDPQGKVGYIYNPDTVTDTDENGPGRLPGPSGTGVGQDGKPVEQKPYSSTNMKFFEETAPYVKGGLARLLPHDIAEDATALDAVDTLMIADTLTPEDPEGRSYDAGAYLANVKAWVERGGNLVLTDRAIAGLQDMGIVAAGSVGNTNVYQPYADFQDFGHPLLKGLRPNARQLAEYTLIGHGIGNTQSPMTTVSSTAWSGIGGVTVGTSTSSRVSVGEAPLGEGKIRITNGLRMANETLDHRYGLKDFALTYSGLYILENSMVHDAAGLGDEVEEGQPDQGLAGLTAFLGLVPVFGLVLGTRRRRRR